MAIDFSKFDNMVNGAEIDNAIKEAKENGSNGNDYPTPEGEYIAKLEKLELKETQNGGLRLSVMMRAFEAGDNATDEVVEYMKHYKKGKPLFTGFTLTGKTYPIQLAMEFLTSLDGGVQLNSWSEDVKTFSNLNENILPDILEAVADSLEYRINYTEPNGYGKIEILEVFELE